MATVAETSAVVAVDATLGIIAGMLLRLHWIHGIGLGRLPDNEAGVGESHNTAARAL